MTAQKIARPLHSGTPVRVYRNLRKGVPAWSIQAKGLVPGTNTHRWYVMQHADAVILDQVTFKIYEKGRQRVLATGVKNVHAYALGVLVGTDPDIPMTVPKYFDGAPVDLASYNPRRQRTFTRYLESQNDVRPVHGAHRAWLTDTGKVWVAF